ncbi:helix-turn-helix domain-containing protein [Oceanobacillus manasiensis]|uniref:helix-turn-helix domain-containing protein n=1 Tax=Oceanobacillus manasiensis TaxID=586413 RepID=UPI0005A8E104|nr:helix-turn-helix transcriptional regulator [Oceanobacillus manasiensis]
MKLGERIIQLRERQNWSQRELAKRIQLNVSVMNRIELGERPVKDHELGRIATVLEVTTDYLLGRSENPARSEKEDFEAFRNDPALERWYKTLPQNSEEDLRRLKRIWEAFKEE